MRHDDARHAHEDTCITGVADVSVRSVRDQAMVRLDGTYERKHVAERAVAGETYQATRDGERRPDPIGERDAAATPLAVG